MQIRVLWREITNERVELGRRGKLWNEELCKLNRSLFQIFRVILNLVNCKLKAIFILLSVLVPFFPPPPISTPRAFFSDKQRNRALMKGRQPGVGGNGGGGWDEWGRRENVGPFIFRTPSSLPFVSSSLFSPFSPNESAQPCCVSR
jgi:hypothetical protein